MIDWARATRRSPPVTVRLVKGAYWDHELVQARQHGWPVPVFEDKPDCDRNFEALTRTLLAARPCAAGRRGLAQPALGGARDRAQPAVRRRGPRPRAAGPARPRRRAPACARRPRLPGQDVLPGRRPGRRDGLPRTPAAREHAQRVVLSRAGTRDAARASCSRRHRRLTNVFTNACDRSQTSRCSSCAARPCAAQLDGCAGRQSTGALPLDVPVRIGRRRARRRRACIDRPRGAGQARRACGRRRAPTRCERGRRGRRRGLSRVARGHAPRTGRRR